jgi:hypothetical protein
MTKTGGNHMLLKYFFAWFGMLIIAFINVTLRQIGYAPTVGDLVAHQISTFTFVCFFVIYFWLCNKRWKIETARQAWLIGLMWLFMTAAFEFGFGHYVAGNPWSKLLYDYNLPEGRLWSLVLLSMLVGPYCFYRWQNRPDSLAKKDTDLPKEDQ